MPHTAARQLWRNVAGWLLDGRRFVRAGGFGRAGSTLPSYRAGVRLCLPRVLVALAAFAMLLAAAGQAHARRGGIAASGCEGCHGAPGNGKLTMTANPAMFGPGQRVELTLSIVGNYSAGGAYITDQDVGVIDAIANQGLTKVSSGLVHNQPKPGSGGTVQFRFGWTAPAAPGAVRFEVYALGANGDNRSGGDNGLDGNFDFVYGCNGKTYFLDGDADGIGRDDYSVLGCDTGPPMAYSATQGDCDDYRKTTYPGATELCNMIDDDCDGQVDEDAVPVELWPDADGDGHYDARTEKVGTPKIGCAGLKGWAAEPGDCKPMDPMVHADAEEACNNVDDDCDGDIDERVRPTCGEGWCRRESAGCDVQYCMAGQPVKEKCNFLDDDCDGLTDEDSDLCPTGQTCAAGSCVASDSVSLDPMSNPPGSSGSTNGTGSSPSTGGETTGLGKDPSSGCALGAGTSHGALAALVLMLSTTLRRRRHKRTAG
jgi:hypothetical protein